MIKTSRYSSEKGYCKNCGVKILIAIFKGSDWCSDDCRKALQNTRKR